MQCASLLRTKVRVESVGAINLLEKVTIAHLHLTTTETDVKCLDAVVSTAGIFDYRLSTVSHVSEELP